MELIIASIVVGVIGVFLILIGKKSRTDDRLHIYEEMNKSIALMGGSEVERRDGIIRLDALLGKSLKYFGVKGDTVGGMLKNSKKLFDKDVYNGLWNAHKLRNRLVHESVMPSGIESMDAVKYFKIAIKRLLK